MANEPYSALDLQRHEIRLIELFPSKQSEDISCRLFTVCLDDSPIYEALSYVWGDPKDTQTITINSQKKAVTTNLYSALLRIRMKTESRIMWIDALCIDQTNIQERNHQVNMMGDIYRSAKEAVVWLGEPKTDYNLGKVGIINKEGVARHFNPEMDNDQDSDAANQNADAALAPASQDLVDELIFEWHSHRVHEIVSDFFKDPKVFRQWPVVGAFIILWCLTCNVHFDCFPFFNPGSDPTYYRSKLWNKSSRALSSMLSVPYWNRVWIIQEVVLAPSAKVYYGPHVAHLGMFLTAQFYLNKHYYGCCSNWGANAHRSYWTWWTSFVNGLYTARHVWHLLLAHRLRKSDHPRITIYDVLTQGLQGREATDPRDHVYGLLGLVTEWGNRQVIADYSLTTAQVYARVAVKIINDHDKFYLLAWNEIGHKEPLPSWVPDWTFHGRYSPVPYNWHLYSAAKGQPPFAELITDSVLAVRGVLVDVIGEVGPVATYEWYHPKELINVVQRWREMAGLSGQLERTSNDRASRDDAFWRTVFADAILGTQSRRATPDDVVTYRAWWTWLERESTRSSSGSSSEALFPERLTDPVLYGTKLMMDLTSNAEWGSIPCPLEFRDIMEAFKLNRSRMFFITKAGCMGTGPTTLRHGNEIRVGDEIHLVAGSSVPFVLRPVDMQLIDDIADEDTSTLYYSLVGTCYLHGVMDGEAMGDLEDNIRTVYLR